MILKRTVRGMLPTRRNQAQAFKDLRVMIGTPSNLVGEDFSRDMNGETPLKSIAHYLTVL